MISLLKIVANYFCADTVQNFQKSFSPEIGKKIASNLISITDESQSREGFNSCAVDLEGSPAQKKKVVEKGNLTSFLYDTYTATKENRLTTANFFRKSGKLTSGPAPTNFYIEAGESSHHEMVKELKKGFFVEQVDLIRETQKGVCLKVNVRSVEKGTFSSDVTKGVLEIELQEFFKKALLVGAESCFGEGFGSPEILFDTISISS
jgi:PmbA protein